MENRVYNFSPGPGALPLSVLEKARDELLNYQGLGMSIMEMSHRTDAFVEVVHKAREGLRALLQVPEDFEILFLQGGATLQFYMVPLNLLIPGKPIDIIHTGHWSMKAINELHKFGEYRIVASSEDHSFLAIPHVAKENINPDASYVYLVSNNTIYGTQWFTYPDTGDVPLVVDMTSDILTKPIDFSKFGLIFASAQKNVGIAGVTVVIIRKDLAERCSHDVGTMLQYRTHVKSHTVYNTPPSFAIYMISLMVDWFEEQGGVQEFQKRSLEKSKLLYDIIDESDFYTNQVRREDRSTINVIFRVKEGDDELETLFVEQAKENGFVSVKGHRIAGGMRISLYNAVSIEAVQALAIFMREFKERYS